MREGSGGEKAAEHEPTMPEDMRRRLEGMEEFDDAEEEEDGEGNGVQRRGPFISLRLGVANSMFPLHTVLPPVRILSIE